MSVKDLRSTSMLLWELEFYLKEFFVKFVKMLGFADFSLDWFG